MSNSIYDNDQFFASYAQMDRSKNGLESAGEWYLLKPLFTNLKGKKVLDLGCGYGWHAKYIAKEGASFILAIDSSNKMIEIAKMKNKDPKILYEVMDITKYSYPKDTYDFVISNLVLHYIKDIQNVFNNVYRTLKKNGVFLFNIEHPIFTAGINESFVYNKDNSPYYWPVDDYFIKKTISTNFLGHNVIKEHHTLSEIINGLLIAGFSLETVLEPHPKEEGIISEDLKRPMMLIIKAKK